MANERLISIAMDHLDDGPISYCVEKLMADRWDESSNPAGIVTTLKLHLRRCNLTDAERAVVTPEA